MSAILTEIIQLLVGGISTLASGIGTGLKALVEGIFVDTTGSTYQLTTFGGLIIIFGAVALAIGLCRYVVNLFTNWGN